MKKILIILFAMIVSLPLFSQTYLMGDSRDITGCGFNVYDNGGDNAVYSNSVNQIVTIHSSSLTQTHVQIELYTTDFDVHPSDTLYIYNGDTDADSLLLDKLNNGIIGIFGNNNVIYTATMASTGNLTLKFVSDADSTGRGFTLVTRCVTPCQQVNIKIDPVLSSHHPHLDADGFYYVDLCPWDTLHMVAYGEYPENNFAYYQADSTSTFKWDLGFDNIDSVGMTTLNYYFEPGRGYDIAVGLEDWRGCVSYMPQIFRIRTSQNPIRNVSQFDPMCTGQELQLSTGYDNISSVQVDSITSEQLTSLSVNDTIFLPDGQDCGNGCNYQSPVVFTSFNPSARVTSANDILYVRVKMEHSFVGDLYIRLICPNQQYSTILRYGGSGSSSCNGYIPTSERGWSGSGSTSADFGVVGPSNGSVCDQSANPMGTGWNYCWSNNTTEGYVYSSNGSGYVYQSVTGSSMDSSNTVNFTQFYHPEGSFANLIGCPLNGQWSIEVIDGWGGDNGYIFAWELALDPRLLPQDWTYTVLVDTTIYTGPGADGPYVIPDSSGNIDYIATVIDEFGCAYDTSFTISITQSPKPDLGEDVKICQGDRIKIDSHYEEPYTTYIWSTGGRNSFIYTASGGEYVINVFTGNADNDLICRGSDTIQVYINPQPIADFEANVTEACAPMKVRMTDLTTPDSLDLSYSWQITNEEGIVMYSSYLAEPGFTIDIPGLYDVKLVVESADGCIDSITKHQYLNVHLQPIAEFAANPEISMLSEGGIVVFTNYADSNITTDPEVSFHWNFGDNTVDSSEFSPTHTYQTWGDYDVTLFIETGSGCLSEITHTVVIEADLEFPNVITPNGDNVNDVFAIINLNTDINPEDPDEYRTNNLYIYDRWGKKVYEAKNYDTYMKGDDLFVGNQSFSAKGLSDGVYYYTFYYKGRAKTINYHGTISVIR